MSELRDGVGFGRPGVRDSHDPNTSLPPCWAGAHLGRLLWAFIPKCGLGLNPRGDGRPAIERAHWRGGLAPGPAIFSVFRVGPPN